MNTVINSTNECKSNNLWKKSSFRRDGSYRIFHITKKQKEDSDNDDDENFHIKTGQINDKEKEMKTKYQRKSFKISNRNGLDGWKRKSTKNKRLLFLQKASCESTSNEIKSHSLTNDLSSSINISNDIPSNELLKENQQNTIDRSSEYDVLVETIDRTLNHDDTTLNDLLERADKLETTFQKQEFYKIQPLSRISIQRKRKRFIIACSIVLIIFIAIITVVIFVVLMTLRYKTKTHQNKISQSSAIYDPH